MAVESLSAGQRGPLVKRLLRQIAVLIADSDGETADQVEAELKRHQIWFRAQRAWSRAEYEKALREFKPDIILAALQLPDLDGVAALRLAQTIRPDSPFILLANAADENRVLEALRHGAVDYVMRDRVRRLGPAVLRALDEVTARAERKQADAALRESEERFRIVASATTDGVWDWDLRSGELWLSESLRNRLQYPETGATVDSEWLFSRVHPDEAQQIREGTRAAITGGEDGWSRQYRLRRGDGRYVMAAERVRLIRAASGEAVRAVAAVSDTTEPAALERLHQTQFTITRILADAEDLDEAIPEILETWSLGTGADAVSMWLLNDRGDRLINRGVWCGKGPNPESVRETLTARTFGPGEGLPGKVWELGAPLHIDDIAAEDRLVRRGLVRLGFREVFAFPIRARREFTGAIESFSIEPRGYPEYLFEVARDIGARIGIATQRLRAEKELRFRLTTEALVAEISTAFINVGPHEIDTAFESTLARAGEFMGVDRAYVIQIRDGRLNYSHEWVAPGIPPERHTLSVTTDAFPWIRERLRNGQLVAVSSLDELPPEAAQERQIFERRGARAVLAVPLSHSGTLLGLLGFHMVRVERIWTPDEIAFLRLVAQIFTNTLIRHQASEAIHRLSRQNQLILESATEGVFGLDLEGLAIFVNPAGAGLLGYAIDELLGKNLHSVAHYQREDGSAFPWNECPAYLALTQGETLRIESELMWRKDGTSIRVAYTSTAVVDEHGNRVGALVTVRDIEKEMLLQRQLEQAHRLSSLGRVAATIAHEFNNVLMGIQPFAELIRKLAGQDGKLLKAADQITRSVQRGRQITQEILRYTRPAQPNLQKIDVDEWIRDFVDEMRGVVRDQADLELSGPDMKLTLAGDPLQLLQVFTNIVLNARDAMPRGGTIRIRVEPPSHRSVYPFGIVPNPHRFARISISDTGTGMTLETQEKIFEPLFTTKKSGTGLGLAVAHQILQQHGGYILVESEVGKGSTFHVFLPATIIDGIRPPDFTPQPLDSETRLPRKF